MSCSIMPSAVCSMRLRLLDAVRVVLPAGRSLSVTIFCIGTFTYRS